MTTMLRAPELKPGNLFMLREGHAHTFYVVTGYVKCGRARGINCIRLPGGVDYHFSTGKRWMEVGDDSNLYRDVLVYPVTMQEYRIARREQELAKHG